MKFFKRQLYKILLYVLILIILTLIGYLFGVPTSILSNISSFVTFIFIVILQKTWLEDYKSELDKKLETYKAKLSGYTLVTKLQYDLEFKIYTEIYEGIFKLYVETCELKPIIDVKTTDKDITNRLDKFSLIYNNTSDIINKYRPFYSNEIYNILIKTRNICREEADAVKFTLQPASLRFNYVVSLNNKDKIRENLEKVSNLIRKRIENMKIVE